MPRPLHFVVFSCILLVSVLLYTSSSPQSIPTAIFTYSDPVCDVYSLPGYFHLNPSNAVNSSWRPYVPSPCDPPPNILSILHAYTTSLPSPPEHSAQVTTVSSFPPIDEELVPLVNQTVLLIGDSVDRNGLEQLSTILNIPYRIATYENPYSPNNSATSDWDPRNLPHILEIPSLNLTFISVFHYGLDDIDEFSAQDDWHYPGLAEDRIDLLFAPMAAQLLTPPTFISLHSGLWDLAFFGRRDRILSQSLDEPLSHDRVLWYRHRLGALVERVQAHWPGTPLWIRKMHRVGEQFWASHDWSPGVKMGEGFVNFFTNMRCAQIRDLEELVAQDHSLPVFDFGHIWEGWQHLQDKVHPLLYPGGTIFNQALLHYVWMETQGRNRWMDPKTKHFKPYPDLPPKYSTSDIDQDSKSISDCFSSTTLLQT